MPMDFKFAVKEIFKDLPIAPPVGSIWAAPNKIWDNAFARNQKPKNLHPAIVAEIKPCNTIITILPGTTRDHNNQRCAYEVNLQKAQKKSYFLFALAMPYSKDNLLTLRRGWDGIDDLNNDQLKRFNLKIEMCLK